MKKCLICKEVKPLREFYRIGPTGYVDCYCKPCKIAKSVKWRQDNTERWNRQRFAKSLERRHGLTLEMYEQMLMDQGGVCAGCKLPPEEANRTQAANRRLAVDHDHRDGHVRGLLCHNCNLAVGNALDSAKILRRLADYLNTCF